MYQRPTIAVVGSVRRLTLEPIQACKLGFGSDNSFPEQEEGLADLSGEDKEEPMGPDSCFVS